MTLTYNQVSDKTAVFNEIQKEWSGPSSVPGRRKFNFNTFNFVVVPEHWMTQFKSSSTFEVEAEFLEHNKFTIRITGITHAGRVKTRVGTIEFTT